MSEEKIHCKYCRQFNPDLVVLLPAHITFPEPTLLHTKVSHGLDEKLTKEEWASLDWANADFTDTEFACYSCIAKIFPEAKNWPMRGSHDKRRD